MVQFILRRLALLVPILLGMSLLVFLLMQLLPGDPVTAMLGTREVPEAVLQVMREQLHLDDPVAVQYVKWLSNVITGNFGISFVTRQPLQPELLLAISVTANLAVTAIVIAILIGIPVGIIAAVWKNTWVEYVTLVFSFIGISTPSFFLGTLLILIFGQSLNWLPTIGFVPITEDPGEWFRHIILPAGALGVTAAAAIARMVRASLLEVLTLDYVRTARAKGLSKRVVIIRHALPNAMLPTLTLVGLQFGSLLGGAAIIETVFALPGLGRTALVAITGRDYPMVQLTVLFAAMVFVVVNLLTDVLYAVADPIIRLGAE